MTVEDGECEKRIYSTRQKTLRIHFKNEHEEVTMIYKTDMTNLLCNSINEEAVAGVLVLM